MSIITQALKKAQYEQRLQQTPQAPYGSLAPWRPKTQYQRFLPRLSYRFSGLIVAGVGLLCAGIVTYIGQSARAPFPTAMTVPVAPQPASEPELRQPPSASALSPQVLKQLQPELRQPVSPPRTDVATSAMTPLRQARPLQPALPAAQHHAPLTPVQTARVAPELRSAEQRARAQRHLNRGTEAYNAGAFDDAEMALQRAITLDPTLKRALNRLGNLYYQRGAYQRALAMYQQALDLDPDYLEARNNLGNAYMQLNMSAKAIAELNKALLVDRESGLTYYNMACIYAQTREPDKAIRYLEMAIAREPEARHWAKTDTDFTAVRSTSAFQKLLGTSS